jgi:uncharacterized protein (DUF362 family)
VSFAPRDPNRRELLAGGLSLSALAFAGLGWGCRADPRPRVHIARAASYELDLVAIVKDALAELGFGRRELAGKRVLLKPNLVETSLGRAQINTHPAVVRAVAEALRALGAATVVVGEGPGHRRDTLLVLDESGFGEMLATDRLRFVDINRQPGFPVANAGQRSGLLRLTLPAILAETDLVVSIAKLKTHHWAGVTLTMKNLFGLMPGSYYGWPKNVLHYAGLQESILDIAATIRPGLAIVDGIVGMEGDGPILGEARSAGVLLFGTNPTATDATAARVMGVDPTAVRYLAEADGWLGPIAESGIVQTGETIAAVRTPFRLVAAIPAQKRLLDTRSAIGY